MGMWLKGELEALGVTVQVRHPGKQQLEGQTIDLPPILLGSMGSDKGKKTVCIYGHYDVQPAEKGDGWATEPFVLTEDAEGRLLGRGSTDDKGPILGWLWVGLGVVGSCFLGSLDPRPPILRSYPASFPHPPPPRTGRRCAPSASAGWSFP
jgi:acetylornithine deacetylase/succinyl-diaminopimelate desuccinylase-like protein